MADRSYVPGVGQIPFGNQNANPQASRYAVDAATSTDAKETILLRKAIERAIYSAVPEQYYALKLIFEQSPLVKGSDEFEYLEHTFGRTPMIAAGTAAAVVAVASSEVTQVIPVTADSVNHFVPDDVITYPDGTPAVVRSVSGTNITVASYTGLGLPAVASGDYFAMQAPGTADGTSTFSHFDRMQTITRYNYIQEFMRVARWGNMELQKYKNMGTTDYLDVDKKDKMDQLRTDLFVSFFNGTRGEFRLASTIPSKSMGGILPTMTAAGSMRGTPTTASLRSDFETLAFKTNYKKAGGTRFIYGCDEILYELSKAYKDTLIRYAPNDNVAKMNLSQFEFGTMKFVPVPTELFKERSCFPASWQRKMLVLDQESIKPCIMQGIPMMDSGGTLDLGKLGTREKFQDTWYSASLSLQFNNPLASFSLDIQ
jgi:hypothetical protein